MFNFNILLILLQSMRCAVQCTLADRITRGRIHGSSHPNGCLYTSERKERAGCTARVAQATSDYLHWAEPPSRSIWLLNCARDGLRFMKPDYLLLNPQEPATEHIPNIFYIVLPCASRNSNMLLIYARLPLFAWVLSVPLFSYLLISYLLNGTESCLRS